MDPLTKPHTPLVPQNPQVGDCGPGALPPDAIPAGADHDAFSRVSWSWQQFKEMLGNAAATERYPVNCPAMLELGPLRIQFEKLRQRSLADDEERLRIGGVSKDTGELNLSRRIALGNYAKTHAAFRHSAAYTTVLDFHTRTQGPLSVPADRLSTISPTNLQYFLSDPDRIVSAVVAPEATLVVMKTGATPRGLPPESLKAEVDALMDKARARGGLSLALNTFTMLAGEEYGLALYTDVDCEAGQVRRVR